MGGVDARQTQRHARIQSGAQQQVDTTPGDEIDPVRQELQRRNREETDREEVEWHSIFQPKQIRKNPIEIA
jgi:hypothetical protein